LDVVTPQVNIDPVLIVANTKPPATWTGTSELVCDPSPSSPEALRPQQ